MQTTPHYDRAIRSVRACERWSREGFPGASYEDWIRIANDTQPEELLIHIRQRAEHEFKETIDRLRAQQAETPVQKTLRPDFHFQPKRGNRAQVRKQN